MPATWLPSGLLVETRVTRSSKQGSANGAGKLAPQSSRFWGISCFCTFVIVLVILGMHSKLVVCVHGEREAESAAESGLASAPDNL